MRPNLPSHIAHRVALPDIRFSERASLPPVSADTRRVLRGLTELYEGLWQGWPRIVCSSQKQGT